MAPTAHVITASVSTASAALLAATFVLPAEALTDCDSIGPDVIIGDIPGVANYSSVGGIEAFSIGTTSCNIGHEELLWIAGSSEHPVIAQSLYRLRDGRFEQIGQSWLKHGFLALAGNVCGCGCIDPNDGSRLGVGCSDPYSAGLNGFQNGLGPKFEVNAATGVFAWPPTDFTNTGNQIYKRLQAAISDLDPALDGGGMYFVEGHYVTPDDAAAGNNLNNASWRRAVITGSGASWNMELEGNTVREQPALRAWAALDSTVSFEPVDVPDDGRLHLAWKPTQRKDGQWDYELALHNMTSDRSVQAVRVALPPDAQLTSSGFHDVSYHSGEPFDGTDWTAVETPGEIRWETETFDANPNANALRWGTTYNYRFVADVAPNELGSLTIDLFKPGEPASIEVPLIMVAPANDDCDGGVPRPAGAHPFSTYGATDSALPANECGDAGSDIWFNYLAPVAGTVTIGTCDADFDTWLALYDLDCPSDGGALLGCANDVCGTGAEVTVSVDANTVFRIRIAGVQGDQGTGTLTIALDPSCSGDIDGDGIVGIDDLLTQLAQWGPCTFCSGDLDFDQAVTVEDLLALLGAWGPCP